ncbi:hypothetical protein HXA31_11950 [Salipaludibacillus agaradhaerens]|jgi:hypothetical protein|uniref:Lipoprotein n=1 Tax=Salipaludibacillus agaradhaerens TaxID=76935 RepID=A0A9Q4AZN9_SALAG|nr:hypothetical protein [Salipaludibacillus agaradhaerens]MCR6095352.1 hypothetical protein [Salipaludibacillus agaradhaerens]MCR6115090.1 hypothetical protein [Salipaludibacillus agaradhaerens]
MNKLRWTFILSLIIVLQGCGNGEETFDILFFTKELSKQTSEAEVSKVILEHVDHLSEDGLSVTFHVPMAEKFFIEVASHEGDLIIADEVLLEAGVMPDGLQPLDSIVESKGEPTPNYPYEKQDPQTGEWRYYALPLSEQMTVIEDLGVEMNERIGAIIPIYSDYNELSLEVLQILGGKVD